MSHIFEILFFCFSTFELLMEYECIIKKAESTDVNALAISPSGQLLALGFSSGDIHVYKIIRLNEEISIKVTVKNFYNMKMQENTGNQ